MINYCKEVIGEIQHRLLDRCGLHSIVNYDILLNNPIYLSGNVKISLIFESCNVKMTYLCQTLGQWDLEKLYTDVLENIVKIRRI